MVILDKNSRACEQQSLGKDCVDESAQTNPTEDNNNPQINGSANVSNNRFEVTPERENNDVNPEHPVTVAARQNIMKTIIMIQLLTQMM